MLNNRMADGLVLKVAMCQLRIWKLQFIARLDAVSPFLIIPVRECIFSAHNGKGHCSEISQKAVIKLLSQKRIRFLQLLSLV